MKLFIALTCVFLASCAPSGLTPETWRASEDNGCKPGIGMELVKRDAGVSGAVFILDPNKPHDFTAGRRCPMQFQRQEPQDLYFTVEILPERTDKMHLHLASPLAGELIKAILQMEDGSGSPVNYEFRRTP